MWSNRGHLAGLVALVAVVAGGVAYAAIPGAGGLISACRDTKDGELRVVEEGEICRKGELPLSWNQRGAPGPPGLPGIGVLSRIEWNNGGVSIVGSQTPKLVDTAGTLTKLTDGSRLQLTWQGAIATLRATTYQGCQFFLMVGDRSGRVRVRTTVTEGQNQAIDPITLVDVFDGVPAGEHTVTIWAFAAPSGSPDCVSNAGGWPQSILVEELSA